MKYLFYAHTHTLFLTALGVVNYLKLKPEDVIFLYTRNYANKSIKIPYKEIDLSDIFSDSMKNGEEFYFWKLNKLVTKVDDLIAEEISEDYIAYLPHVGVFLPQVLATNKYCKGIRFVEEGLNCYSSSLGIRKNTWREFLKRLYSFGVNSYKRYWFSDSPFFHEFLKKRYNLPTELFGISFNSFFSLNEKKHVVKWPNIQTGFSLDASNPIYIFEAAIEQKFASKDVYLGAVRIMIIETAKYNNYIKFHPGQSEENKNTIRQYFLERNLSITELPFTVPFELIMVEYPMLEIIGFNSSLLLYGKLFNHKVVSYDSLLMNDSLYIHYKKTVDYVL
ncbi:polysialyltransferase family glycosyltransferase [Flavobacterium sp. MC2016-06]|jgi:hypothetical protein|uniref:polysialyltransferase family glycosyltransferase n=1 Tax=Flavobacterium sp. MC2016-06 TaxID=2676308 RepID=UPI0012BAA937|nr:polysialyltransferase family glycosyltransferase [Flavobacterium sp. MC2016-06]MBU3862048.1 alpha-2,8-polysialyltransferase family protein [Flavobacterium sp. MC2016-06]